MGRWTSNHCEVQMSVKLNGLVTGAVARAKFGGAGPSLSVAQVVESLDGSDPFMSTMFDIIVMELAERNTRPGSSHIAASTGKALRSLSLHTRELSHVPSSSRPRYLAPPEPDSDDMGEDLTSAYTEMFYAHNPSAATAATTWNDIVMENDDDDGNDLSSNRVIPPPPRVRPYWAPPGRDFPAHHARIDEARRANARADRTRDRPSGSGSNGGLIPQSPPPLITAEYPSHTSRRRLSDRVARRIPTDAHRSVSPENAPWRSNDPPTPVSYIPSFWAPANTTALRDEHQTNVSHERWIPALRRGGLRAPEVAMSPEEAMEQLENIREGHGAVPVESSSSAEQGASTDVSPPQNHPSADVA